MDFREFLIGLVVAMEDLLVVVRILSVDGRLWLLWIRSSVICCDRGQTLLDLRGLREVVVHTKALGIELVLHAEKVASVVHIVTWGCEVGTSLNGALGHIKVEALVR